LITQIILTNDSVPSSIHSPDIGAGQRHCHCNYAPGTSDPHPFGESWTNNTCITHPGSAVPSAQQLDDAGIYLYGPCDMPALPEGESSGSTFMGANTFMTPGASTANMSVICTLANGSTAILPWAKWQAAGYDKGTVVKNWPTVPEIISMAKERLLMKN
jgi:hypothetical protein